MIHPIGFDNGGFRVFGKIYDAGFHVGHDINCPMGTKIKAIADGVVCEYTGQHNGYGSLNPSTKGGVIFIKHGDVIASYGHCNISVKIGDEVKEGQVIGTVASFRNGDSFLPHLHFGIWKGLVLPLKNWGYVSDSSKKGNWIDPLVYIKG